MKSAITTILIFGLAGMAFLGIFGIDCDADGCGNNAHRWCFAAQAENTPCPGSDNSGISLNFHLGALKIFSNAVFSQYAAATFVIALAMILAMMLKTGGSIDGNSVPISAIYIKRLDSDKKLFASRIKFYRWLSLRETNPAYS